VEQNPEDEPASELLKKIDFEKAELLKKGEIKKQKPLPKIQEDEKPFKIPPGWEWCKLGELSSNIHYGYTASAKPQNIGARLLRITDIQNDQVNWNTVPGCEITESKAQDYLLEDDDILIARTGGTIGKSYLVEKLNVRAIFASYLIRVKRISAMFSPYIKVYLGSTTYWKQLVDNSSGTGQPNVNATALKSLLVPIATLEEQKRIVAKVDQLMALCDRLEAQQQKRSRLVKYTRISALEALANAQGGDELQTAWKRVEENLPILFENPEDVEDLKKCVLQNAVMGKLVPQNPDDEPASELLKKIAKEKAELIKKGEIKKQKPLPEIREDEKPFEIPAGWEWCRFPEIGELARGKSKHRPRNDIKLYQNGTIPLVQTGDVARSNGLVKTYTALYNEVGLEQSRLWPKGTLCITIAANIANTGILTFDACFPDSVVGFISYDQKINIEYFDFFIRTAKEDLEKFAPSTAQKNINLAILNQLTIPLPPLDELNRIVSKVKSIFIFCDTLQKQLAKSRKVAELLAQSVVESITGISTEKQEPM